MSASTTSGPVESPSGQPKPASVDSEYWVFPALFVGGLIVFLPLAILSSVADLFLWLSAPFMFVSGVAALVSLFTYHAEAKALKEAGSDWVPRWGLWTVGHLLLSPVVTAPLYLIQRWRHVGLPREDIKKTFWSPETRS